MMRDEREDEFIHIKLLSNHRSIEKESGVTPGQLLEWGRCRIIRAMGQFSPYFCAGFVEIYEFAAFLLPAALFSHMLGGRRNRKGSLIGLFDLVKALWGSCELGGEC